MAVKAVTHYRTKNREALLAYLRSREGEHVTVSEIHDHFRQTGSSMGVATIYRQLEQLVSEGQMPPASSTVNAVSAERFFT